MSLKLKIIIFCLLFILLTVIFYIYIASSRRITPETVKETSPIAKTTIPELKNKKFISISQVETLPESRGGGLNKDSNIITLSTFNLKKLSSRLPFLYEEEINGIKIYVTIANDSVMPNEWTLVVNIYGPDYLLGPQDLLYSENRQAFLVGAQKVVNFLEENRVNPEEIIIEWGETEYIRKKSDEWLKNI